MADTSDGAAVFKDSGDWASAIVCGVFLLIFPPAIYSVWQHVPEKAPFWAAATFTALFVLVSPLLMKEVGKARTRKFEVDPYNRRITLTSSRLFGRSAEEIPALVIKNVVFETSEGEDFFYRSLLRLADGREFCVAQGSHRPAIRAECERFLAALAVMRPDLRIVEEDHSRSPRTATPPIR